MLKTANANSGCPPTDVPKLLADCAHRNSPRHAADERRLGKGCNNQRLPALKETGGLALYEAACYSIAQAKTTDEVKDWRDKSEAMRAYAHQAKNRELEIDAAEIRIRAERRLGELIRLQKETVGLATGGEHGGRTAIDGTRAEPSIKRPTLAEVGIDKKLSSHAQKVAAIPEPEFEGIVSEWRGALETANERVTTNILKAANKAQNYRDQGTGENEWYTPTEYAEMARDVMGGIDLDPASCPKANKVIRATRFFTKEDDGLAQAWHGRVWLNPPYSRDLMPAFCNHLALHVESGAVEQAILVSHNNTDTAWFSRLSECCSAICFPRSRIRFYRGEDVAAPVNGQAFFYFGQNKQAFKSTFGQIGNIWVPA